MCNEIRASGRGSHFAFTGLSSFLPGECVPRPSLQPRPSIEGSEGHQTSDARMPCRHGQHRNGGRTPVRVQTSGRPSPCTATTTQAAPHRAIATYRAGLRVAGTRTKTGINFMEDVVNIPIRSAPEFLAVSTGGTVINLSSGRRRVQEIFWRDKMEIFNHPYIVIEDEDMDTREIINTAHIISIK